ncbi:MAG: M36 family metallopeptidase, partial [Pseudobdellovibrionaceae bacterium]|nr:M36 family metallopeptidase [Pseudobdellovibrionaceae bacterium]
MMLIRLPLLILGALVGASACSPDHKSKRPRGPLHTPSLGEKTAARFGVTIASSDKHGTPRLVRAIVPRKAAQGATPDQAAREHLATLAPLWMSGGQQADLISGGVQKLQGGSAVVTLRQRVNQIDVHQGDVRVMLHSDGQLSAISGTLLPSSETEGRDSFRMTARDALNRALDEVYGQTRARPGISNIETKEGYQHLAVVATPEFHVQQARAKAEWFAQDGELIPAWVVEVISDKKGKIAAWRFFVSDADGQLLRKIDLIHKDGFLYRVFAESTGNRRPFDGPMQSFTPHPAGIPDGSLPGFVSSNLVAMDSFNANRDPWLPSDATNATGNNVEAFADIRPPVGFSEGDIRAEVRSGRILNYLYDLTQEPLQNPNQSKAAITNAFFVTNWLHDWYYDSGFTEKTGNAQADNYGRGGIGGDRLVVHVQAGATDGARDNAYITTPLDGLSPQLFLFLYGSAVQADVTWLGGTLKAEYFTLGPRNFEITGALSLVDDGVEKAGDGCEPIVSDVKGRIAIVDFDERCASELPLENALKAGALGVIFVMEQTFRLQGGNQEIPGLMIAKADSEGLISALAHGAVRATLRRSSSSPERDTALDNTIVAHEWGHYLHTRLTSCEDYQCRAMSEGWGDFVALHMMLRDEDDRMGTFALNTYAMSGQGMVQEGYQDPGYFGIRRFPYSIDRQKNALSFRHIEDGNTLPEGPVNSGANAYPNSEIHNAGEVWATMLWEAYHALIDTHGVEESRRRMTDYVVAGLLLTPPNA